MWPGLSRSEEGGRGYGNGIGWGVGEGGRGSEGGSVIREQNDKGGSLLVEGKVLGGESVEEKEQEDKKRKNRRKWKRH